MIYGIIWAILQGLWDVSYKISIVFSKWKIPDKVYQFISRFHSILLAFIAVYISKYFWMEENILSIGWKILLLYILASILNTSAQFFYQYSYKYEKVSVLAPYWEFYTIFAVIFGFIFFTAQTSFITFISALIAGVILVVGSFDFKRMKFNKYCLSFIIGSFLLAMDANIGAYILISMTPLTSMFYSNFIAFFLVLLAVLFSKQLRYIKKSTVRMHSFILLESVARLLIGFMWFFMVDELWVVQATLLWMLSLAMSVLFSYILFKEKPKKKEIVVIFLVILFIFLGNYFWNSSLIS